MKKIKYVKVIFNMAKIQLWNLLRVSLLKKTGIFFQWKRMTKTDIQVSIWTLRVCDIAHSYLPPELSSYFWILFWSMVPGVKMNWGSQKNWLWFISTWNPKKLLPRQALLIDDEIQGEITSLATKRMEGRSLISELPISFLLLFLILTSRFRSKTFALSPLRGNSRIRRLMEGRVEMVLCFYSSLIQNC